MLRKMKEAFKRLAPAPLLNFAFRLHYFLRLALNVRTLSGVYGRFALQYYRFLAPFKLASKGEILSFRVKGCAHRIHARCGSSDCKVFDQIFVEEEYLCLSDVKSPQLIIDCGANVGYSTVYFLNRYPSARVIAVEPDDRNIAVALKNLAPFGSRATLLHSAVWPRETGLVVCRSADAGGEEWATQVRESLPSESTQVRSVTLDALIRDSGSGSIDILKIDIEGAETELFSAPCDAWLSKTRNIVIEIHSPEAEKTIFAALAAYRYDLSHSGELTVFKNISGR